MKRIAIIKAAFLALFLGCLGSCEQEANAGQIADTNRYVNCDYGYAMTIPPGLVAEACAYGNHGWMLHFPDQESMISVYNEYNMSESDKPDSVFDYELGVLKEVRTRTHQRFLNKRRNLVQNMHTIEVTASYKRDGKAWKSEIFFMYRPLQADSLGNIVYKIELMAPAALFDKAMPYFKKTLAGLQLLPLPLGPCEDK
jgi:hypothetical protein